MADYIPRTSKSGRLIGFCDVCEAESHRFVSLSKLSDFEAVLEISIRDSEWA